MTFDERKNRRFVLEDLERQGIKGEVFATILRTRDVTDLKKGFAKVSRNNSPLTEILMRIAEDPALLIQAGDLLKQNSYAQAALASVYPTQRLPKDLQTMLPSISQSDNPGTISLLAPYSLQCSVSEKRLMDCIDTQNGLLTVVEGESSNRVLLAKIKGRTTALCVASVATPQGTFVEGNWYSPTHKTMGIVRNAFIEGQGHVGLAKSSWQLMRAAYCSPFGKYPNLLAIAQYAASLVPNLLPGTVRQRLAFFKDNHE